MKLQIFTDRDLISHAQMLDTGRERLIINMACATVILGADTLGCYWIRSELGSSKVH